MVKINDKSFKRYLRSNLFSEDFLENHLEDLDEYLYHMDRMMLNLKRSGKLTNLAALVVGGCTEMKDNAIPFGKNAYEIIADCVQEFNYPVCYGFPAGHIANNMSLIMGKEYNLTIEKEQVKFEIESNTLV